MEKINASGGTSPRRKFLQTVAAGTAALSIAGVISPFQQVKAGPLAESNEPGPDEWFNQIKGKHRMVFDATQPHDMFPFAWPKVFTLTNAATGTPEKDCSVVVVLRHAAIGYAMEDSLWSKYNFGELFKADDHLTKKPATRNPFWKPTPGEYKVPGLGPVAIGINELQENGILFCVCNMALTVYSAIVAEQMKMDAAQVKAEWMKGILPGIEVMPSGVWAVGRAQEKGCAYCFAG
ncbi:MAG: twin-arginine translocation signal domain-containing protein [Ferruginibacter sp.]